MDFAYEGFTHNGDNRCFQFRSRAGSTPSDIFQIRIELLLFLQNKVPVQDGPGFCLQLLETASTAEPNYLDRFHSYSVVSEDFRPLLLERARKSAERAMKTSRRKPFRKPSVGSNLFLGAPAAER